MDKLIILSDLWGERKSDWVRHYVTVLEHHVEVVFYDCCELAGIDLSDYSEESIHQQFTNGGIERAVEALLDKEKGSVHVLGFSIGGLIAWKALLAGFKAQHLTALSSTRLRYEDKRPDCMINLFYAEHDAYKPNDDWFRTFNLAINIYREQDHEFYRSEEIAIEICNKIVYQLTPKLNKPTSNYNQ